MFFYAYIRNVYKYLQLLVRAFFPICYLINFSFTRIENYESRGKWEIYWFYVSVEQSTQFNAHSISSSICCYWIFLATTLIWSDGSFLRTEDCRLFIRVAPNSNELRISLSRGYFFILSVHDQLLICFPSPCWILNINLSFDHLTGLIFNYYYCK